MGLFGLLFTLLALAVSPVRGEQILVGTGSQSGVYFQVGRSLCRLIGRHLDDVTCRPLPTPGSAYNLANVSGGALEFGIVQSDIQHHAVHRSGRYAFDGTPYDNLRALFSLYTEPFNLIVRRDSGISGLDDLHGRRVNIGNPGSGHRATMEVVMRAKGWTGNDFQLVNELPPSEHAMALCHDQVEAIVYTVGHPNPSVSQALKLCDAGLVDVAGGTIDGLVAQNPYYAHAQIAQGTYPGMEKTVQTFGTLATLVTSADVDEQLVYGVVRTVFEQLDRFKRMHKAFAGLRAESMIGQGLAAPLHPGAERYYREQGWLE